ncbi:hypothetical protein [Porticoccus sp.]|uniref:hypothetical protein n=1 Tax=Porticoccus sp. TaxID=2024853 RepID=UPI003F69F2D1
MPRVVPLFLSTLMLLVFLSGCSVNPVTGENQFSLMSAEQEVAIGASNYAPSQQSQGGRYLIDPEVQAYVSGAGKKLAAVSDRPDLPYEFVVLNNSVPNAWLCPVARSPSIAGYSWNWRMSPNWPPCWHMKLSTPPPGTAPHR